VVVCLGGDVEFLCGCVSWVFSYDGCCGAGSSYGHGCGWEHAYVSVDVYEDLFFVGGVDGCWVVA